MENLDGPRKAFKILRCKMPYTFFYKNEEMMEVYK